MLMSLPRFLVYGLVLAAIGAAVLWFAVERDRLPEPCLKGSNAIEAGDHDLAIDQLLLCLESGALNDAQQATVYYALGGASFAKGKYLQAVEDYSTAIEIDPSHAWAYNNRCWTLALLRRPDDALKDCNQALSLLPDQPQILDSRALAYWRRGDHVEARWDLQRARDLDSSLPPPDERFKEFEAMY